MRVLSAIFLLSLGFQALAAPLPPCVDNSGAVLPIDNGKVLGWKEKERDDFRSRAHVRGVLAKTYAGKSSHQHFKVLIGKAESETVEVIYNVEFGLIPAMQPGVAVEVCGDYITARVPANGYPPSPDKAIIHWVHENKNHGGHKSGFVAVDGHLFGYGHGRGSNGKQHSQD